MSSAYSSTLDATRDHTLVNAIISDTSESAAGWSFVATGMSKIDWWWRSGSHGGNIVVISTEASFSTLVTQYWKALSDYRPRTSLGRTLWELRSKIIESGIPMLNAEELEREIKERRGEHGEPEE